ncbi:hypothetical protein L6452_40429 [Arctium lappa]|uniref:Uncharacterized protein n=1 Tax=Arctium lappa TaxID=4217 RepID=A0ACB8XLW3_ARCLA|nr:hypothetical protein L6452_40429 [Arctium lappa]
MDSIEQNVSHHLSDGENLMPSVRYALPSRSNYVNAQNPDDQMILQYDILDLRPNNHHLYFELMKRKHLVILEFFKGHPLKFSLSGTINIPIIGILAHKETAETMMMDIPEHNPEAHTDSFDDESTTKEIPGDGNYSSNDDDSNDGTDIVSSVGRKNMITENENEEIPESREREQLVSEPSMAVPQAEPSRRSENEP